MRHLAPAVVVGLAVGLFIDALLAVWLRITLLYVVLSTFGLVLVVPPVAGVIVGILFGMRRGARERSRRAILLLAVVLWPAALVLPFAGRMLQMAVMARNDVPGYPGARLRRTVVELGEGESFNDRVRLVYCARTDSSRVLAYYHEELASRGWMAGPQHLVAMSSDGTPHWFAHTRKFAFIHIRFRGMSGDGALSYDVIYGI